MGDRRGERSPPCHPPDSRAHRNSRDLASAQSPHPLTEPVESWASQNVAPERPNPSELSEERQDGPTGVRREALAVAQPETATIPPALCGDLAEDENCQTGRVDLERVRIGPGRAGPLEVPGRLARDQQVDERASAPEGRLERRAERAAGLVLTDLGRPGHRRARPRPRPESETRALSTLELEPLRLHGAGVDGRRQEEIVQHEQHVLAREGLECATRDVGPRENSAGAERLRGRNPCLDRLGNEKDRVWTVEPVPAVESQARDPEILAGIAREDD